MLAKPRLEIAVEVVNLMSVEVSTFEQPPEEEGHMAIPPYGMAGTSGELDAAMSALYEAYPIMLSLAENEKAAQLLSDEIERTRRRVNSLEYILIRVVRHEADHAPLHRGDLPVVLEIGLGQPPHLVEQRPHGKTDFFSRYHESLQYC
jgi:hypothetical protein